ncbi:MAG: site-specific integrase [Deltaproteobacteria bacterium]|jgi:integrase|nr:site-specific integrase [Deltaproteobacteria bacterium]
MEAEIAVSQNSFKIVAKSWFENKKSTLKDNYTSRIMGRLEKDLFPFLVERPINEISASELFEVLRKIEARGAVVTAHRRLQYCGQIFRRAIANDWATHDISANLKGALKTANHTHFLSLKDPKAVGELFRAIDAYTGNTIIKIALQIAPYVFVRPGELRRAEWKEFNLDTGEWRIPAGKMKMKEARIVPLSSQVIDFIKGLKLFTGKGRYLFPSMRSDDRPISDMTLLARLRRLGFSKEEMMVHGFRSIVSAILN